MADEHKTTTTAHEPKTEAKKATGKLAPAGESGDPAVQKALADLYTAQQNRAALDVEAGDVKAADDQVAVAQKALADLGYE